MAHRYCLTRYADGTLLFEKAPKGRVKVGHPLPSASHAEVMEGATVIKIYKPDTETGKLLGALAAIDAMTNEGTFLSSLSGLCQDLLEESQQEVEGLKKRLASADNARYNLANGIPASCL